MASAQRLALASPLVLGVLTAALVFASRQPQAVAPARVAGEDPPTALGGGEAAAVAHASAGIMPSTAPRPTRGFSEHVAALEHRVRAEPDNPVARLELARLLHDGHRVAEAVPHYLQAINDAPAAGQPYYDVAAAYVALGRWQEAESILLQRLKLAPGDAIALYDLGAVLANRGRADEALVWWAEAEAADPGAALLARIRDARLRLARSQPRTGA